LQLPVSDTKVLNLWSHVQTDIVEKAEKIELKTALWSLLCYNERTVPQTFDISTDEATFPKELNNMLETAKTSKKEQNELKLSIDDVAYIKRQLNVSYTETIATTARVEFFNTTANSKCNSYKSARTSAEGNADGTANATSEEITKDNFETTLNNLPKVNGIVLLENKLSSFADPFIHGDVELNENIEANLERFTTYLNTLAACQDFLLHDDVTPAERLFFGLSLDENCNERFKMPLSEVLVYENQLRQAIHHLSSEEILTQTPTFTDPGIIKTVEEYRQGLERRNKLANREGYRSSEFIATYCDILLNEDKADFVLQLFQLTCNEKTYPFFQAAVMEQTADESDTVRQPDIKTFVTKVLLTILLRKIFSAGYPESEHLDDFDALKNDYTENIATALFELQETYTNHGELKTLYDIFSMNQEQEQKVAFREQTPQMPLSHLYNFIDGFVIEAATDGANRGYFNFGWPGGAQRDSVKENLERAGRFAWRILKSRKVRYGAAVIVGSLSAIGAYRSMVNQSSSNIEDKSLTQFYYYNGKGRLRSSRAQPVENLEYEQDFVKRYKKMKRIDIRDEVRGGDQRLGNGNNRVSLNRQDEANSYYDWENLDGICLEPDNICYPNEELVELEKSDQTGQDGKEKVGGDEEEGGGGDGSENKTGESRTLLKDKSLTKFYDYNRKGSLRSSQAQPVENLEYTQDFVNLYGKNKRVVIKDEGHKTAKRTSNDQWSPNTFLNRIGQSSQPKGAVKKKGAPKTSDRSVNETKVLDKPISNSTLDERSKWETLTNQFHEILMGIAYYTITPLYNGAALSAEKFREYVVPAIMEAISSSATMFQNYTLRPIYNGAAFSANMFKSYTLPPIYNGAAFSANMFKEYVLPPIVAAYKFASDKFDRFVLTSISNGFTSASDALNAFLEKESFGSLRTKFGVAMTTLLFTSVLYDKFISETPNDEESDDKKSNGEESDDKKSNGEAHKSNKSSAATTPENRTPNVSAPKRATTNAWPYDTVEWLYVDEMDTFVEKYRNGRFNDQYLADKYWADGEADGRVKEYTAYFNNGVVNFGADSKSEELFNAYLIDNIDNLTLNEGEPECQTTLESIYARSKYELADSVGNFGVLEQVLKAYDVGIRINDWVLGSLKRVIDDVRIVDAEEYLYVIKEAPRIYSLAATDCVPYSSYLRFYTSSGERRENPISQSSEEFRTKLASMCLGHEKVLMATTDYVRRLRDIA